FKARHPPAGKLVALKVIGQEFLSVERLIRTCREAISLARLQHPNVVAVYDIIPICDVGELENRLFFSLELVDGGTLEQRLNTSPPSAAQGVQLLDAMIRGVSYAHGCGQVHGYLRPSKVFLPPNNIPKIADFGLLKLLAREPGDVLGTQEGQDDLGYLAPEVAWGRFEEVGPATDVYGLGAILYKVLTLRPPFLGPTPA